MGNTKSNKPDAKSSTFNNSQRYTKLSEPGVGHAISQTLQRENPKTKTHNWGEYLSNVVGDVHLQLLLGLEGSRLAHHARPPCLLHQVRSRAHCALQLHTRHGRLQGRGHLHTMGVRGLHEAGRGDAPQGGHIGRMPQSRHWYRRSWGVANRRRQQRDGGREGKEWRSAAEREQLRNGRESEERDAKSIGYAPPRRRSRKLLLSYRLLPVTKGLYRSFPWQLPAWASPTSAKPLKWLGKRLRKRQNV